MFLYNMRARKLLSDNSVECSRTTVGSAHDVSDYSIVTFRRSILRHERWTLHAVISRQRFKRRVN